MPSPAPPANLNLSRTMRNSFGRRVACGAVKQAEDLRARAGDRETRGQVDSLDARERRAQGNILWAGIREAETPAPPIPYIDPSTSATIASKCRPEPNTKAVMFCLMDVSGSMGQREKDLAKRFFILLHLFLEAALREDRHRLHSPHPRGQGSRRGDLLLRPRDRRHGGQFRADQDARGDSRALSDGRVEHLRRPGLRRRQLVPDDSRPLRHPLWASSCRCASTTPMSRSSTSGKWRLSEAEENGTSCGAPTARCETDWPNFAMKRIGQAEPTSIRCSASCSPSRKYAAALHARRFEVRNTRKPTAERRPRRTSLRRFGMDLRYHVAHLRGDRGASPSRTSVSTSIPTRSRSSPPSRCSTPTASIGMPLMYSTGRSASTSFARRKLYRKGYMGLAYEIVINSNPCISYNMEENTMAMQALVMAHAAFGHNHFFKNNYLFQQWTDAEAILDYLRIRQALHRQERGAPRRSTAVEETRCRPRADGLRRLPLPAQSEMDAPCASKRARARAHASMKSAPSTISGAPSRPGRRPRKRKTEAERLFAERKKRLNLPEENLLYFIEKNSPSLEPGSAKSCASCATSPSTSIRRNKPR